MKRIVVDLDNTITLPGPEGYADKRPNLAVIARLREYRALGFQIVIHTARNMNTHANNLGLICAQTLPVIHDWLARHDVPCDEIWPGKPWCGHEGFYVDDRAIRPDEFLRLDHAQIMGLIDDV